MTAAPQSRKLGTAGLIALGLAALATATLVSRRFLLPRPGAAPESRSAPALSATSPGNASTFQVVSASGTVEAERGGAWVAIKNGDMLSRTDVVRTSAGAHAVLHLSAGSEIELRERVEIALDRLPGGATVDLRRGKLEARVNGPEGLEITSHDTRTANDGPAHFVVRSDGQGRVSVAALTGRAKFTAGGKSLTVPAGSESRSEAGAPPSDPERIGEEVLLEVVWPAAEQRHSAAEMEIKGRAAPSSEVTVNGTPAEVGADGHFTAALPLHTGKNAVDVAAEDLAGRTRRESTTLVRHVPPRPALTPETTNLWKK